MARTLTLPLECGWQYLLILPAGLKPRLHLQLDRALAAGSSRISRTRSGSVALSAVEYLTTLPPAGYLARTADIRRQATVQNPEAVRRPGSTPVFLAQLQQNNLALWQRVRWILRGLLRADIPRTYPCPMKLSLNPSM